MNIEDHKSLFASYLNAASRSIIGISSLTDPTTRRHKIILSSSGNFLAMEKNLAAGDGVVVSLTCSNSSETKTIRANISAAASAYLPSSILILCLVSS